MALTIRLPEVDDKMKQLGKNIKESPASSALGVAIFLMTTLNVEVDPVLKAQIASFLSSNTDAVASVLAFAWAGSYGLAATGALLFARFSKGEDPAVIEAKVEAEVQRRLAENPTRAKEQA